MDIPAQSQGCKTNQLEKNHFASSNIGQVNENFDKQPYDGIRLTAMCIFTRYFSFVIKNKFIHQRKLYEEMKWN